MKNVPWERRLFNGAKIDPASLCWNWQRAKNNDGYGSIHIGGRTHLAHRKSYELYRGEIPDSALVCHACDNPCCINPSHLFLGSQTDNMRDMAAKNRGGRVYGIRHPRAKLTEKQIASIRSDGRSGYVIACEYGISKSNVYAIKAGQTWKHI
jgi:hypothetical protein